MSLQNLTFCCTGLTFDQKSEISHKITAMGGSYYVDLRSDVQYLLVGDKFTDKYSFCIKNRPDIVFLKPSAIDLMYRQFKNGHKFVSPNAYKLPVFETLKICLSNVVTDELFDASQYSTNDLVELITANGGVVSNNLTINQNVVITNVAKGKRYLKALEWKIPVIHPVFLLASLKRGASVSPGEYLLANYPDWLANHVVDKPDSMSLQPNQMSLLSNSMIDKPSLDEGLKIKKNPQIWDSLMNPQGSRKEIAPPEVQKEVKLSIFNRKKFKLVHFSPQQMAILTNIITKNDGQVVTEAADILLVPFGLKSTELSALTKNFKIPIKTEWLVERSMYYTKWTDDEWSEPIMALSHANHWFNISLSGFKGIELLHITKLCEHLGFSINENFNSKINLLIINIKIFESKLPQNLFYNLNLINCSFNSINYISTKNKILAAKNWKVPIISVNYLFEIVSQSAEFVEYPNLKNLDWCLYYPNKSNEFIEYLGGESNDSLKLPSPKKMKRKFGKLDSTEKLEVRGEKRVDEEIDDLNFNLDIGYKRRAPGPKGLESV